MAGPTLGPSTAVIDGQRFAFPTSFAYSPMGYGPQTTGVPNASPTIPPAMAAFNATAVGGLVETQGQYGAHGSANAAAAKAAHDNPWNPRLSPVLWAVAGLLLSLLYLQRVHWSPVGGS